MITAGNAESRHVADVDTGDILDQDWEPIVLAQYDILDVVDVITLGQIVIAAAVDQADAADVYRLLADGDLATADVDIGVAEGAERAAES